MTAQTRSVLYTYFETGDIPTQAQFGNLIDSFLNIATTSGQSIVSDVSALGRLDVRKDISVSGNATIGGTVSANALFVNTFSPTNISVTGIVSAATFNATSSIILNGSNVINKVIKQQFIANGTYTPTAGMKYCIIECWGGGGAGGSIAGSATGFGGGGGGGAGGYSRLFASAATIGASKAVTIGTAGSPGTAGNNPGGNGGDTSVGILCIAKGGSGGGGCNGNVVGSGGAGGIAGTGDLTATGPSGHTATGANVTTTYGVGGMGGSSFVGGGGISGSSGASADAGHAATGFASGGSGASANGSTNTAAGGAGTAGLVFITEYISA